MSKSLIQTANTSQQTVAVDSVISLGSVLRRFGCNCRLNGNAIEIEGEGYYTIDVDVTATPTVAGNVTVSVLKDGVAISGATATNSVSTVGKSTTLSINTTVNKFVYESSYQLRQNFRLTSGCISKTFNLGL